MDVKVAKARWYMVVPGLVHALDQRSVARENRAFIQIHSGFGCIRCGSTIYLYCAQGPDPARQDIFLLCPPCLATLNHQAEGARTLALLRQAPVARQSDFDISHLPYGYDGSGAQLPEIALGGRVLFQRVMIPLVLDGVPLVAIEMPEVPGGALVLDITLLDADGERVALVSGNGWVAPEGWSFRHAVGRYSITGPGAELQLRFDGHRRLDIHTLRLDVDTCDLSITPAAMLMNGEPLVIEPASHRLVGAIL